MTEISRKAYKNIQKVAKMIHDEIENQIIPQPVVMSDTQIKPILPENVLIDALRYLEHKELIRFRYDKKYSLAYYEYDKKCREAAHWDFLKAGETWESKNEQAQRYKRMREAEAQKGHHSTFTIDVMPEFNVEYGQIMSKYDDFTVYKLHLGEHNDMQLFVNNIQIGSFKASWRQQIFKTALSQDNGTIVNTKPYMPKTITDKKAKGMSQIMPEIVQSKPLREVFFPDIHSTSFKIYHTITRDMVDNGFCDTILVDKELKMLNKKYNKKQG